MPDIVRSISGVRVLEELSRRESPVHRRHPFAKLAVTLAFLVAVAAGPRRELVGLLPFALYPFLTASLAEVPARPLLERLLLAAPIVVGIGALNPLFDREAVALGGITVPGGWLVFASLALRCALTVSAALLLVATTRMEELGGSMRALGFPRVLVLQLLLTYRYIALLLEELATSLRAHALRAPGRRGIGREARGSLPGRLLLRSYDRGRRVYDAMRLRGFDGEYRSGAKRRFGAGDLGYVLGWCGFFLACRLVDLPGALGALAMGLPTR
ncbi:MAG: cobalt ECF transporter T component CbiQ [Spirochaetaceae bacterium]|nr:cobalt ECF transporter T component CbiQ [Spirochaetaceae bacterium]